MKKRLNVNHNNPYQKKDQLKDQISEKHLLHMFLGMDTSFMGIALHVEDLDTKLQTVFKEETLKKGITLQASDDQNTVTGLVP